MEVASGGKIALTALAVSQTGAAVLATRAGDLVFSGAAAARPMLASHVALQTMVVARPNITASAAIGQLLANTRYASRTLVREERLDALFPCNRLGAFYIEERDTGPVSVGCTDALRLGQVTLRLYEEIAALSKAGYRVFRSLQQPGRFLVLPSSYCITRYGPGDGAKAYRPAILMHSYTDIANPADTRVLYHATLQPDITPAERRRLRARLCEEAANPVIEYPTELYAETSYTWAVGSMLRMEAQVVKAPDAFQATFSTDLGGAVLLQQIVQTSGLEGNATFRLADGTPFSTNLTVKLTQISGPWISGPLDLAADGGQCREVYALYQVPPGTVNVEEVRSFVEDILTNIVFIDLINYGNHGLARLNIQARIKNVPGTKSVSMTGTPPRGAADFLLPLTAFLGNRILQFQVTKVFQSSAEQATPWLEWNLEMNGNVVSLTWELIQ